MASSMEALEELLPDIDNFVRHVLKKEKLSSLAERKRRFYVERLDLFILPPDLPPRPDGQPAEESNNFLAHQRALSRANATPTIKETVTSDVEEYSGVGDATEVYSDDELYEVPEGVDDKRQSSGSWSDGTSYESYDEEEETKTRELVYENQILGQEVLLPSVKSKVLKELSVKSDRLSDVTMSGELSQRGTLSWPRRYCVISRQHLCVYKSERDSKPLLLVPLPGYDALYLEKEYKRSHVIRLSQPAQTTHWFCASTSDSAHGWVEHLNAAASDLEIVNDRGTEEISGGSLRTQGSTEQTTVSLSQSNLSSVSSEGSSGDGVIQTASDQEKKVGRDEANADKKKFSLQNFLTFGKKKGDKVIKRLTLKDIDTDTSMAGQLNICSDLVGGTWQSLWCVVRHGCLECFREMGDDSPLLSMLLTGLTIENAAPSTKRELSLKLLQFDKEMLCVEARDVLDHGRWLNALIKQTAPAPPSYPLASVSETDSVDTDTVYSDVYEDSVNDSSNVSQKTVAGASSDEEDEGDTYDDVDLEPPTTVAGASSDEEDEGDVYDDVDLEPPTTAHPRSQVISSTGPPPLPNNPPLLPSNPPPLPNNPPPVDRLLRHKLCQNDDLPGSKDGSSKHCGLNFEAEMTAKFSEIHSQYKLSLSASDDGVTCSGDSRSSGDSGVSLSSRRDTSSSMTSSKGSCGGDVIKTYTGCSISQDREILECAENPILGELRRGRLGGGGGQDRRQRMEEISRLRDKSTLIRKNRQQVRGQKLASGSATEKQRFEDELEKLDSELEKTECKLTKLQLLVQEKDSSKSGNLKLPVKNKSSHSTSSVTRVTRMSTSSSAGRRQNHRSPQKKQAVSVINKCIKSKVVGTVARQGVAISNGLNKTQNGANSMTSTVQQKLKLWESISDSSSTC